MQPGDCGYFDDIGDWQRLGRVHEPQDHGGNAWESVVRDVQQPAQETLGPMTSALVDAWAVGGTVGVEYVSPGLFHLPSRLKSTRKLHD